MNIIVLVKGGVVQSVLADQDCDITVVDYDTDGIHADHLRKMPDKVKGYRRAYIYPSEMLEINPQRIKKLKDAIKMQPIKM